MDIDLFKALQVVKVLVRGEGQNLLSGFGSPIRIAKIKDKTGKDFATEHDLAVELSLVNGLSAEFPEVGFELEENKHLQKTGQYRWVIDPIDGTKYFASGIPLFSISVALVQGDEPILGVIYNPISQQLYAGSNVSPAEVNGRIISISKVGSLAETTLSVDFTRRSEAWGPISHWSSEKIRELSERAYRIRMLGVGSLSLAWVAAGGAVNAYTGITGNTKFVDVAAGLAICKAAGAEVKKIINPVNGGDDYLVGSINVVSEIEAVIGE